MKQSKIINFLLGKEAKLISELLNKPEEWIMESYSPIVKINHISGLFIESNFLMEFKYPTVHSDYTDQTKHWHDNLGYSFSSTEFS